MNVETILNMTPQELRALNREDLRRLLEPLIPASRKPDEEADAARTQKNLMNQIAALRKMTGVHQ